MRHKGRLTLMIAVDETTVDDEPLPIAAAPQGPYEKSWRQLPAVALVTDPRQHIGAFRHRGYKSTC